MMHKTKLSTEKSKVSKNKERIKGIGERKIKGSGYLDNYE